MWAYYGNHKGCCIEYECPDDIGIRKVEYITEMQKREEMDVENIIESLYMKGNEWKHENEWRLVYYAETADDDIWKTDKNGNAENVFLKAKVNGVLFGLMSERDEEYIKMLQYLSEYNVSHEETIEVSNVLLRKDRYELMKNKQFNIKYELKKL